jgi:hypothetical protein
MDSTTIIERIKNVELLKQDDSEIWSNLTEEFPFFTCAQWLKFGHASLNGVAHLKPVALYKSDPLEFARYKQLVDLSKKKQVAESNIDTFAKKSTPEIISTNDAVDVVITSTKPLLEVAAVDEISATTIDTDVIAIQSIEPHTETISLLDVEVDTQAAIENNDVLQLINELPNSAPFELTKGIQGKQNDVEIKASTTSEKPLSSSTIEFQLTSATSKGDDEDKSLMVMMSFTEWLNHFKHKTAIEKEETKEKKALKAAWQKEKLAEAADEELDEIPEPLFKQAMDSISMESSLISEALAEILAKQGKKDKAISMYKKLSLRNPEKSPYFANLINELNLNNE